MANRDLIVVGASLGGVETLVKLMAQLPADLPAAILIVQHTSPHRDSLLSNVLSRSGPLPVTEGRDGETIESGRVYLARPDQHMLVKEGRLRVGRGPRENGSRPAIDPLFRSAATTGRNRTIGVILSGLLDDGAAGLHAVKRCGGVTVVQDPEDALHPDMPRQAMLISQPDYVMPCDRIGSLLETLTREVPGPSPPIPSELLLEARLTERALDIPGHAADIDITAEIGAASPLTCPECGGALWQMEGPRFRCHVGHAYSLGTLMAEQDRGLEQSLWAAVRSLEERWKTLHSLAGQTSSPESLNAVLYQSRADECRAHANRIREMLMEYSQHWNLHSPEETRQGSKPI